MQSQGHGWDQRSNSQSGFWLPIHWHPFRSMSISYPTPETQIFQNLNLKMQGQIHKVTKWVWLSIDSHPFCSMSISPSSPGVWFFNILPWKYKVKVIAQGYIVGPTSYWLTSFLFHTNRPSHSWNTAFSKFYLENSTSRSWEKSKFKATKCVPLPIDSHPFHSISIGAPIPVIHFFQHLTLKIQGPGHKPMMLHNNRLREFRRISV